MILGVVLAGGKSTRFGSDKALAELGGRTLLARAVDSLSGFCELVVIAGRDHGPARCIPDWPHEGEGPLGGIASAMHHALDEGFETVLTCGVDSAELPEDLLDLLSPAPAYLADQPVIGHWPASAAKDIEAILEGNGRHSMLAFANMINARAVKSAHEPANINTPADLAAAEKTHGI
ncbi:NTP transferase domain-containing protein [Altererythrobacter salegens]|uniref:NTP transferase domain-containing protein n=1 Tax=Croceibacterium salegens TaxID=1737568 RepID=A0A6I4SVM8_9SPHN|nr:molybdenum cofactor guanylyltransferase [Croceibacterium salegens]MXO60011.1 NTP transferase domain-containing protein [Croceibacterium salegens]